MKVFNKTTKKTVKVHFDMPIPRIGETISFGGDILKVLDVHYGIHVQDEYYFVEIMVENKYPR